MLDSCVLCNESGGELITFNSLFRVIHVVDQEDYPGFIRLIVNQHIREMSNLSYDDQMKIFRALMLIEQAIIQVLNPDKINIASFGNVVPHVHWHIIARYKNDKHFPNPIWGNIVNPDFQPASFDLNKLYDAIKSGINFKL